MVRKKLNALTAISAACLLSAISVPSFGSAFQIFEQGGDLGTYHAGSAATANDASTAYNNPAGLVRLDKQQIAVGVANIQTHVKFHGNVDIGPMSYKDITTKGGGPNIVPNFHYASPINDKLAFGFSIVAALGLNTDYNPNSPLSIVGKLSTLQVIDISPSLGFKITPEFSVGAGIDAQNLYTEFSQNLKYSYPGPTPIDDVMFKNVLRHWGYGYHLGALYQINPSTRIGLAYHAKVVHHATGHSEITMSDGTPLAPKTINLKSTLISPATTSLGYYQDLNDKWTMQAGVTYTQWSSFKSLDLIGTAMGDDIKVPQNFRDTWKFDLGGIYKINPKWQLKAGVSFEQSPVKDASRTIQVPDNDRWTLAAGAKYNASENTSVDFGYAHLFIKNAPVHQSVMDGHLSAIGMVNNSADVYQIELIHKFD